MRSNRINSRLPRLFAVILSVAIGFSCPFRLPVRAADAEQTTQAVSFGTGIYTLESNMNFRSGPSLDEEVICVIPKTTVVLIDRIEGVWGHTTFNGAEGWLSLEYSSASGDPQSDYSTGKYRTDVSVNFRSSAAELKNNIIGLVPGETVVTVLSVSRSWGKISYGGKTGWISLEYCSPYVPEEETTSSEPSGRTDTPSPLPVSTEAAVDWLVLDISRHNAVEYFDWPALRDAGVMGVIIRVGGRGVVQHELYDDVSFYQHYLGAKSVGLHVGAYFFSYALTEAEAVEEAQRTVDVLRSCRAELDMPVYIDIEDYTESDYTDNQHERAGKAACTKVVDAFCNTVKEAGYYPGVYCNKYFAEYLLEDSVFEGRSLWMAHYASECGYRENTVSMWQYTGTGTIDGYAGKYIDKNRCYVNYPAVISGQISYYEHGQTYVPPATAGMPDRITTIRPTCTQNGAESLVKDGTEYEQRILNAQHGQACAYVCEGDYALPAAGQCLAASELPEGCVKEGNDGYSEALAQARKDGGCRFTRCGTCGEVLNTEYYFPSSCDHVFEEEVVTVPTCKNEGLSRSVCTKCGKVGAEKILGKADHLPGELRYCPEENGNQPYYGQFCCVCQQRLFASFNFIPGDVDGNLKTDSYDARLALRHATRLEQIGFIYLKNADFNKDGAIDPADARLILRRAVNLE